MKTVACISLILGGMMSTWIEEGVEDVTHELTGRLQE